MEEPNTAPGPYLGKLGEAIARNSQQVREARAAQIVEASRLSFRRKLEDKVMQVKAMEAQRSVHLDLSPDNSQCLISAKHFSAENFIATRIATALSIKNTKEELDVLVADYVELFGVEPNLEL